jgi:hypothetical protein
MICPQRIAAETDDENVLAEGIGKMNLQDSDILTQITPTDTGSVSEDDTSTTGGGGVGYWLFGGIIPIPLAKSLKETAGGVAAFVHRSAVAAAREFQVDSGSDGDEEEEGVEHHIRREQLRLPWEIRRYPEQQNDSSIHDDWEEENEQKQEQQPSNNVAVSYEEDMDLKEKIHALSAKEDTFLKPFTAASMDEERFLLDKPRIELVNRIRQVDEQLGATHARLSGRVQEIVFWRNYFHHCQETRRMHLQQQQKTNIKNNKTQQQQQGELRGDDDDENDDDDESSQSSSSLVPADDDDEDIDENDDDACNNNDVVPESKDDDDASFINIPTPPPSTGIRSVDSMVFVDEMCKMD